MTDAAGTHETRPPDRCKLGRAIETYDLVSLDDDLIGQWTGPGETRSLRELAEVVNTRLVREAMERANTAPLDGEPANVYRLLTSDDVSRGVRTDARNRLAAAGVPVEELESRFVSHQTVHTHLTDCLDVSQPEDDETTGNRRQTERDRIRALESRTAAVSADAIERLASQDALQIEEFDVLVEVAVLCGDCGRRHEIGELTDRGGCPCHREAT